MRAKKWQKGKKNQNPNERRRTTLYEAETAEEKSKEGINSKCTSTSHGKKWKRREGMG